MTDKSTAKKPETQKPEARKLLGLRLSYIAGAVLILAIAGYVLYPNPIFAVISFAAIAYLFFSDIAPSSWTKEELGRTAVDIIVAFIVALAVWFALSFVLSTSSPLDVVTSCSMLPVLERGDLIVLQGGSIKVPEVQFTGPSLPTVQVQKSACTITRGDQTARTNCTNGLLVEGQQIAFNKTNDVIVYEPDPASLGLIIHRAFLKLHDNSSNRDYFITMGDNNPAADQESRIGLVPREKVHGKVLFRIPYVGYLKLFLFLQFQSPPGCDIRVQR